MKIKLALSVLLAASLAACGGGGSAATDTQATTVVAPVVTQPPAPTTVVAPVVTQPPAPTTTTPEAPQPPKTWTVTYDIKPIAVQPARMHAVVEKIPECVGALTAYVDMVIRTSAQGPKSQRETYMAVMMSLDGVPQEKQRSVATLRIAEGALSSESTYEFRRTLGATPAMSVGLDVYKFTYFDYTAVEIVEATLQLTCGAPAA